MLKTSLLVIALAAPSLFAQQTAAPPASGAQTAAITIPHIPPGAKLFIEPMNGFETSLSAAMLKKNVPVVIVDDKAKSDFVLSGTSKVTDPSWAKMIFVSPNAHAEASIMVKTTQDGTLAFAYNVDKGASRKGTQSIAEACAKHLKEAIDKGAKK